MFGADGISSNRSITILSDGKELLTATPTNYGMGAFTITPDKETKYTATLIDGKSKRIFNLPVIEEEGAVVNVEQSSGSIVINIMNNLELETEIGCTILHRGKTHFYERYLSSDNEMTFAVDRNSLNDGVNRVVLFIGDSIPLAERMFFVAHDKAMSGDRKSARLTVSGNGHNVDSLTVEPYEKIKLSIGREDGNPIEEGREWFEKAIEKEESTSLYAVAIIMEHEDSIAGYSKRELRRSQTVRYLIKAAEKNHLIAQYKLAQCYESGKYVKKSKKEAFRWYKKAASQGHPQAMERVGHCYEKGRGVKKNEAQAAHWYSLAEQNGQEYAKKKMEWYNISHFFEE